MPEPAQIVPQRSGGSFASLLASFTRKLQDGEWDDSALADDVATLTYEQALRATSRNRPLVDAVPELNEEVHEEVASESSLRRPGRKGLKKKHKSASITVRVTAEEQAQLHERASAAHLTVSAYLRSCIFEAEALRSQVKEALAHMQSAQANVPPFVEPRRGWCKRLFPIWSHNKLPRADS